MATPKIVLGPQYTEDLRVGTFEVQELEDAAAEKVALCSTSSTSSTSTASTSSGR